MDKRSTIPKEKKELKKVPLLSGVYFFEADKILYIGKAKNLRSRLTSYFAKDISGKTKKMVQQAEKISFIPVNSELESLLLEARLVKKHTPRYNIELRDDKHPLYIKITKDTYPQIVTARKHDSEENAKYVYGPFPSSTNVRTVLRMLRRIFPYSDHKIGKRACLRSQIGLCNPCPNIIEKKTGDEKKKLQQEYIHSIQMIRGILDGRLSTVRRILIAKMKLYSDKYQYERAAFIKNQLDALTYVTQPITKIDSYIKNPHFIEDIRRDEMENLRSILEENGMSFDTFSRIECYDVAHLGGSNATASMVTFVNAVADKKLYRHFKIKQKKSNSDTDSLREVIKRRTKYFSKWGKPDLIVVDGGKGQASVFFEELTKYNIPVIGLAKRFETIIIPSLDGTKKTYQSIRLPRGGAKNLMQRMRDEAHRFARRYHHKLIQKELLS